MGYSDVSVSTEMAISTEIMFSSPRLLFLFWYNPCVFFFFPVFHCFSRIRKMKKRLLMLMLGKNYFQSLSAFSLVVFVVEPVLWPVCQKECQLCWWVAQFLPVCYFKSFLCSVAEFYEVAKISTNRFTPWGRENCCDSFACDLNNPSFWVLHQN